MWPLLFVHLQTQLLLANCEGRAMKSLEQIGWTSSKFQQRLANGENKSLNITSLQECDL